MKWKLAGFLAVLTAVAGLSAYSLRSRLEASCLTAHELARHGGAVKVWLREAAADPYLGDAALRGPPNTLMARLREEARILVFDWSARFLPETSVASLRALAVSRSGAETGAALNGLESGLAGLTCRTQPPAMPLGDELTKLVDTANVFWAERRAVAVVEKQEFARDTVIFCKAEDLLRRLREVLAVAAANCQRAKPGSKLEKNCREQPVEKGGVAAEIQDLESQRELNLKKLRRKWPEGVMAGLQC